MKNKIIATLITLLILGGLVSAMLNETILRLLLWLTEGLLISTIAILIWYCIFQIIKLYKNN